MGVCPHFLQLPPLLCQLRFELCHLRSECLTVVGKVMEVKGAKNSLQWHARGADPELMDFARGKKVALSQCHKPRCSHCQFTTLAWDMKSDPNKSYTDYQTPIILAGLKGLVGVRLPKPKSNCKLSQHQRWLPCY